ncbi:MAG: hypothetical protein ACFFAO_11280, partial [Candidatus Hermodarchaeota archaeon]
MSYRIEKPLYEKHKKFIRDEMEEKKQEIIQKLKEGENQPPRFPLAELPQKDAQKINRSPIIPKEKEPREHRPPQKIRRFKEFSAFVPTYDPPETVPIEPKSEEEASKKEVKIVCPLCKNSKTIKLPKSVIHPTKPLTTVTVPKGEVCEHLIIASIDKDFKVRGYQKTDYELTKDAQKTIPQRKEPKKEERAQNIARGLESLRTYRKSLSAESKEPNQPIEAKKPAEPAEKKGKMTLKEIYDEFWEFIEETNPTFRQFILGDERRKEPLEPLEVDYFNDQKFEK